MSKPQPHTAFDLTASRGFRWYVNDRPATPDEADEFDDRYGCEERMPGAPAPPCRYCGTAVEQVEFAGGDFSFDDETPEGRAYYLESCPYCCHWVFEASEGTKRCMDAPVLLDAQSVARTFDAPIPQGCAAEVARRLRQDPSFWHTMAPRDMERFVADVFRANHRHAEVVHVGKPGDLGVDVLFVDAGGEDWLVQVKRRESPSAVEGFETLQRLLGTLVLEGKLRGIIASTASRFSRQLHAQRRRAEARGFRIELLDRGKLDRMLHPLLPSRPWLALLDGGRLSLVDGEVRQHFLRNTSNPRQPRLF